jgi:hypothetical protein
MDSEELGVIMGKAVDESLDEYTGESPLEVTELVEEPSESEAR